MEKLLHERLREYEKQRDNLFFEFGDGSNGFVTFSTYEASKLADEIERYYIPRPRFEDGEPVQFGDKNNIEWDRDGEWCFNAIGENGRPVACGTNDVCARAFMKDGFVKRPAPKVYDADGVEIKVGDTVYNLENDGEQGTARCFYSYGVGVEWDGGWRSDGVNPKYLTHERPVFDAEGVRICKGDTVWHVRTGQKATVTTVYRDDQTVVEVEIVGHLVDYEPSELTHRESDSLEKLRDDMVMTHDAADEPCSTTEEWIDRLTALIERGA